MHHRHFQFLHHTISRLASVTVLSLSASLIALSTGCADGGADSDATAIDPDGGGDAAKKPRESNVDGNGGASQNDDDFGFDDTNNDDDDDVYDPPQDAGTGGAGDAGDGATGGQGTGGAPENLETDNLHALPVECQKPIVPGLNSNWMVNGMKRSFYADFPSNTADNPALTFSFHGFLTPTFIWRGDFNLSPNADPSFPMIVITPVDTKLMPLFTKPQGLDWDLSNGSMTNVNRDASLVQSIVACLKKQNSIDVDRIYSVGFSAGSVMTALLHSRFQRDFAAIAAFSGMWFNDKQQVGLINPLVPLKNYKWDALDPKFGGTVLMSRGGPGDVIKFDIPPEIEFPIRSIPIVDLEIAGQKAVSFVKNAGRAVIECTHNGGHTYHPKVNKSLLVRFLKAHKRGEPSPYLTQGLDSELARYCTLQRPNGQVLSKSPRRLQQVLPVQMPIR